MIGGMLSSLNPAFAAVTAFRSVANTVKIIAAVSVLGLVVHSCNKVLGDVRSAAAAEREIAHLLEVTEHNAGMQEKFLVLQKESKELDTRHRTEIDGLKRN